MLELDGGVYLKGIFESGRYCGLEVRFGQAILDRIDAAVVVWLSRCINIAR